MTLTGQRLHGQEQSTRAVTCILMVFASRFPGLAWQLAPCGVEWNTLPSSSPLSESGIGESFRWSGISPPLYPGGIESRRCRPGTKCTQHGSPSQCGGLFCLYEMRLWERPRERMILDRSTVVDHTLNTTQRCFAAESVEFAEIFCVQLVTSNALFLPFHLDKVPKTYTISAGYGLVP
jgi:hypothetical protein